MNRRRVWLVLALVLLALAGVLMYLGQGGEPEAPPRKVDFPRRMREEDRKRAWARRTQVLPPAPRQAEPASPQRPRDPVLAALPRGKGKSAMVFEANALRHSPVGELLLACLMRDGGKNLARFREETGVDPLQDLDRVVVTEDGLVLSGNFAKSRLAEMLGKGGATAARYGDEAQLYEGGFRERREGADAPRPGIATWKDQMIVLGDSPESARAVIDRVEGRGPEEAPVLGEEQTYGEMYGVLSVDLLARMLAPQDAALAQRLREAAENVELHLDASGDVALVADVRGQDAERVQELGKSLGAALAVARVKAQAEGEKELAQLLDFASVDPSDGSFKLELAVPLEVLRERLAFCREPLPEPPARPGLQHLPAQETSVELDGDGAEAE